MLISFGSLKIKWLLLLIVPSFIFFCNITEYASDCDRNFFFYAFLRFFSRSLNFILWIILNKSLSYPKNTENENDEINKKEEIKEIKEKSDNNNINNISSENRSVSIDSGNEFISEYKLYKKKMTMKKKMEQYKQYNDNKKLLFLTAILDFIATTIKYICNNIELRRHVSGGLTVLSSCSRLLLIILLSHFLIKNEKLKRHQYFSAIIILIIIIIISVLSLIFEEENNNDYFIKLVLMIVPEFLYIFVYICGAIYLSKSQGNIYKMVFFNGITGLILSVILQIILSFFNCDHYEIYFNNNKYDFCDNGKIKTILENFKSFQNFGEFYTFFSIIFNFVEIVSIWLLIYYYSINHFASVYIIPSFFDFIFKKNNLGYKLMYIIGCIVIILMALVYNEIIILKFCGFEKNTKKEITKRALTESSIEEAEDGQRDTLFYENDKYEYYITDLENDN